MNHEFRLVDIGEGLTGAEIVSWLGAVGDRVVEDQPVVEIETDKAVVEMPAPVTGTVVALGGDVGSVISVNENRTRVRYATNTENGASGSPCFSVDWGLVALHHYGEPSQKPATYNQGIPIDAVRARLAQVGKAGALGLAAP